MGLKIKKKHILAHILTVIQSGPKAMVRYPELTCRTWWSCYVL